MLCRHRHVSASPTLPPAPRAVRTAACPAPPSRRHARGMTPLRFPSAALRLASAHQPRVASIPAPLRAPRAPAHRARLARVAMRRPAGPHAASGDGSGDEEHGLSNEGGVVKRDAVHALRQRTPSPDVGDDTVGWRRAPDTSADDLLRSRVRSRRVARSSGLALPSPKLLTLPRRRLRLRRTRLRTCSASWRGARTRLRRTTRGRQSPQRPTTRSPST